MKRLTIGAAFVVFVYALSFAGGLAPINAHAQQTAPNRDTAAPVRLTGDGFVAAPLLQNGRAFGNRAYHWIEMPPFVAGWQFTQTFGGEAAHLTVTASQSGMVWAASSAPTLPGGWEKQAGGVLVYSDKAHSALHLFRRHFEAGETTPVPQSGWAGTLILAPQITGGPPPPLLTTAQNVPGIAVEFSPASSGKYIGSPALAILPDGTYVAAHDFFGPQTKGDTMRVFGSRDKGRTWQTLCDIKGQCWSSLFVHNGALYLMGTSKGFGAIVIRRSDDGGKTWTTPKTAQTGLLAANGRFHCAPVPLVISGGRIWRAMEDNKPGARGRDFRAFVVSAPANADLLRADSWMLSIRLEHLKSGPGTIWLEGNAVVTSSGGIVDLIRVDPAGKDKAALLTVSPDGKIINFDAQTGVVDFPGGGTKFTVRWDALSGKYWSLTNPQTNPPAQRNRLALISSPDLRHWTTEAIVLEHPDRQNVAFQYVDWLVDEADMVFVSRTAWNGAHSYHDANYLTFHRLVNFRDKASRHLE